MSQDRRATAGFAERGLAVGAGNAGYATRVEVVPGRSAVLDWASTYARPKWPPGLAEAARRRGTDRTSKDEPDSAKAGGIWMSPESADAAAALADAAREPRDLLTEAEDWSYLALVLEYLGYDGWWYGDFDKARAAWTEMRLVRSRARPVRP